MAGLLEVVELAVSSGRWAAGTEGTVVEAFDDGVLVEIADEGGHTLEILSLPHDAVSTVDSPQQERLLA